MSYNRNRKTAKKSLILLVMAVFFFSTYFSAVPAVTIYAAEEQIETSEDNIQGNEKNNETEQVEQAEENEEQKEQEPVTSEQTETPEKVEENAPDSNINEEQQNSGSTPEEAKADSSESQSEEKNEEPVNEEKDNKENQQVEKEELEQDTYSDRPLLITELAPNSIGGGTDYYEYFEVYNNTNQTLNLANYSFYYLYTDSGKEVLLSLPATEIKSKETLVVWFNNGENSLESFNSQFATSLTSEEVVAFNSNIFAGFANGGKRGIIVKDGEANVIISATYEDKKSDNNGKVIQYKYPAEGTEMAKLQVLADPTPGTIEAEQTPTKVVELPEAPKDTEAPVITHESVKTVKANTAIQVEANVVDNAALHPTVSLSYKKSSEETFKSLLMYEDEVDTNKFIAEIPKEDVQEDIVYFVEATDGINSAKTSDYTVKLEKEEQPEPEQETYSDLPLLITELAPNSIGGGTDFYEYFEIYNNSNQPLNLANYSFYYLYTDTGKELLFQLPATEIDSKETLVFWFNNGENSLESFNSQFGTSLTNEEVIAFNSNIFPGFANGGNRALEIRDSEGKVVITASYEDKESDNNGKVIQYKYPAEGTEMAKQQVLADPTPGTINAEQVPTKVVELPEVPKDTEAPVITHESVKTGNAYASIALEATVTDNVVPNPIVTLYYKKTEEEAFKSLAMTKNASENGKYTVTIPAAEVNGNIVYYILASDGINESKTETYTITVEASDIDYTKIPELIVTEVVPDSTNVGKADGYEFVEIYNNTDKAINFKGYKIQYRYNADPASDVVWPSIPDDVVIESQQTLVFWIINAENRDTTVADFNANYGTNLVENKDIVRIYSDGMANGSMRGLVIATNTKEEKSVAYYNDETNQVDTAPDKGILYKYPEDGSTKSVKISAGTQLGTPGTVLPIQVPKQPIHVEEDPVAPVITDVTNIQEIHPSDNVTIRAKATDDKEVKSVALYYRTNDKTDFQKVLLSIEPSDKEYYSTILYAANFIAKESLEYYFVASDGQNEVQTEKAVVKILNNLNTDDIRLNVQNDEILSGKVILKGTSNSGPYTDVELSIDENKVVKDTYGSLETQAYLVVDISGLNMYFKNAITMGEEILYLMDKDNNSDWKTFTIPIDADRLSVGENILTVRAGNKASPFQLEESEENRDDYSLRNVRLILADGTEIRDPEKADPSQIFDMGDDGTYRPFEDFTFTLTEDQTKARTYEWDTTTVSDGEHIIKAVDKENEVTASVKVDNTAPSIETNMESGKDYKGPFTIEASAVDALAGVESLTVTLDDGLISVPFETSSSKLSGGEHILKIVAIDKAGNEAQSVISFSVDNENPNKPELIAPADNAETPVDGNPALKVKVTDPTNDSMDVTYYKGYKYTASDNNVKSFENASDTEPPVEKVPAGEKEFSSEAISAVSELDGNYLTTDSSTQFPYHRFEVELDSSINEEDRVELVWNGKSLEGRKVSMYAWSVLENKWKLLTYKIAGTEDFELKSDVHVNEFANDGKINVLIQDEIPSSPDEYDYTFVWMSDTQYYSESYPHIYQRQTEWIVEKQNELKIKYVLHTGDVVDESDKVIQWERADEYMRILEDNNIPYGVLAGNHDVDQLSNDYTEFSKWFGEDRFKDKPHYVESYKDNRGHYDLISAGGNDFIMVYMGWGVNEEDMQWINDVLKQYPDRKAILNFHEYLLVSGNRSPIGEEIYQKVVEKNENVFLVLSGHYHDSETLISEIDDNQDGVPDRKVYQMLGDYQGGPEGGQGYMKLLHFDQKNNRIIVNTYSPYLDKYNFYDPEEYPGKDELIIDMDLSVQEKQVATDYFAVNVYTYEEIGKQENVASGDVSEVIWKDLKEGQEYAWYVVAADNYTGSSISDIWSFTKGKSDSNDGDNEQPTNPDPNDNDGNDGDNGQPTNPDPSDNDGNDGDNGQPTNPGPSDNDGGNKQPTNPTNPDSNDDGGNNGDNKQPTNPDTSKNNEQNSNKGNTHLPNTATSTYNAIWFGSMLLIAGMIVIYTRRRLQKRG